MSTIKLSDTWNQARAKQSEAQRVLQEVDRGEATLSFDSEEDEIRTEAGILFPVKAVIQSITDRFIRAFREVRDEYDHTMGN